MKKKDQILLEQAYSQVNDNPTMAYMGDYKNVIPLADIHGFLRKIESNINSGIQYISAFVKREEVGDTKITWYYTLKPKEGFDPAFIVKP